ncbi:MAG TPA: penicillin-binding protein 2, partial [Roseiflexaceae bacterium]|nr:penicillin-binding protein 2 [Roseiflexaceae bacterium]
MTEEPRWVLALWLAAPFLLGAARLALPLRARSLARSVQSIGLVVALGFVLLALQLLRQQFVYANDIANRIYIDEQTGQPTSNVRLVFEALRTKRGQIVARGGEVLADTRLTQDGFAVRTYPIGDQYPIEAFSNIVGFFSHRYGEAGLDLSYNEYLNGERDAFQRIQESLFGRQHVGDNLQLTLDARLQAAAYEALGGRTGSVVALDPTTGAVLAMVSTPGFDPRILAFDPSADRDAENARIEAYWRELNSEGSGQPLLNRPTQSRYPPGSTYKTVTAVAALEHPKEARPDEIDCPNERFTAEGAPPVVNAVNNLAERTGNPTNLERVYAYSCNTAFAEYAMRLGPELMADVAQSFGILTPAGAPQLTDMFTDLQTVTSLLYVDAGFLNQRPALADTGYGQGQVLTTPLEMALVAATVANDGVMMHPYLVERITRAGGEVVTARQPRSIRRVMSAEIAQRMRRNMRAVVEYGFGQAAGAVDGVQVGGKSGTAEYPCPTPDAPGRICTHAWYIAVAPLDKPQIAVAVMVEGGGEGS